MKYLAALLPFVFTCAVLPAQADSTVVFNEIMYHPQTNEAQFEWVELYNQMAVDMDLSGWYLTNGASYKFAEGTIVPGGGFVVIASSPADLMTATGAANVYGPFIGRLSNNGDTLELRNNNNRLMDSITYGVDGDWPVGPDGAGVSLAKIFADGGSADSHNWSGSWQIGGTPGSRNFPIQKITTTNVLFTPLYSAWRYEASGSDLGSAWRGREFDDSTWSSGTALFYAGASPIGSGNPQPVTNIFSTGIGADGAAIVPGNPDPHYQLIVSAQSTPPPPAIQATVIQNHPAWSANDAVSSWIGAVNPGTANVNAGEYDYRTSFDLANYDPATLVMQLNVAVDNGLSAVLLNNVSQNIAYEGFNAFSPTYTLTNGFVAGTNALEFRTSNYSTSPNPGGFRARLLATAAQSLKTNQIVALGPTTYYFRSRFVLTNQPNVTGLRIHPVIDDGAVFYLNGTEVYRWNMPGGPVNNSTLAATNVTNPGLSGPIDLPNGALVLGTNVLAVEVHQAASGFDDMVFGAELLGTVTNLPPAPPPSIAFNEIAASTNLQFSLELFNYGKSDLALDGYVVARFGGTYREYPIPPQTLASGGFLILDRTTLGFSANSGDQLVLYGPGRGAVFDAVVVKKSSRGRFPDGTGKWIFPDHATPAASNSFSFHNEIVINEIMYDHRPVAGTPAIYTTNTMIPITNLWRYNQQGVDLGSAWRTPGYNDSTWLSGRALLYNTASLLPAPKSTQIALTNSAGARLFTWYFRSEFFFNGSFNGLQLNLRPIVDDGAVFYLNGVEIYRLNMPDGAISYTNLARASVATAAYAGPFAVPTNGMVIGNNVIAVEVHQFTTNALGADVVFGTELFATMLTSPSFPFHDSPESWLELYNRGAASVDLAGWQLSGGINYSFATNQTIAPGGYLVLAKDVASMKSLYPSLQILGPFGGNLSHQSDNLLLLDPQGNPANEVRYYAGGRWPEYAHAGGSSLELRDPRSDNSKAEAWDASDEASKGQWNSYSYRGIAVAETAPSPTLWKEFVLGFLTAGEVLLDDISVVDLSTSIQLIQNGSFETGLNAWRVIGNHRGVIEVDPDNAANHVLHLTATGPTDHMHNHAETTLANGASVVNGRAYQISFRAKWLAGSSDLNTRLYFNRLPQITSLVVPPLNGTPGARNSRYLANAGPTYADFHHAPVVPKVNQPVTVSVSAQDPDGVAGLTLWWSLDGGTWNQAAMTLANGLFAGTIPGSSAGALVQFYVEGVDGLGARSTFPSRGAASRALFKVDDNQAIFDRLHNIRLLMTANDANLLHAATNVMSNAILGTTVVYDEQQVFYDLGLHLQGSERGRNDSSRVGFTLEFHPDELFRGVHGAITMDRSGGYSGLGGRHDEIVLKHMVNHAGGIPGMYDDLVHVLAPRVQENTTGLLIMAKYGDVYLDSQYNNGGNGNLFKLELIYFPTATSDSTPQGAKLPQPDDVIGTDFQDLGNNKESYRWNFLNENNHARDDYSQIMNVAKTFSFSGAALDAMSQRFLDVNEWMRAFAFESIAGIGDTYAFGLPHNLMVYIRPDDQKGLAFPWDMDFGYVGGTSAPLNPSANLTKIITLPANQRNYYQHLLDLITTTCNSAYISRWTSHYGGLVSQNWSAIASYIDARANFIRSQLPTQIPFTITSNNGNDFGTNNNLVVLAGTAPIQVKTIEVNGVSYALTWTTVTNWTLRVPIGSGANLLTVQGIDASGHTNATDTITVTDTTPVPQPNGFVVINEIMYHSAVLGAGFVEIYNTHPTVTFDLSHWRLDGASFVFPEGSIILPGGFLVVANDMNIFAQTYGAAIPLAGQYSGTLQNGGETLALVRPGATANLDEIIDEVRYDDKLPWPTDADGLGPSLQLIDPAQDNYRAANWLAIGYTPGAANSVGATLAAFPPVWINEILPVNTNGITDNFAEREPWIELFNNGPSPVSLAGIFLTDNYSNLTQWPFPPGAAIGPGQFVVIWADGQTAQTTSSDWHTNFRLTNFAGSVGLVRTNAGRAEVLDYVNYFGLSANTSFGSWPDGQPRHRQFFFYVTPGASNNPAAPPMPVVVNEWMADNTAPDGFPDPADGLFQDWFELYNPNTNTVDLSGYYLTDTLSQPTKWRIPAATLIPGRGFLLVWADNTPAQNGTGTHGDLHANFQLSAGGEAIGLFAPDGTPQSTVTFGQQFQNVSQGRFPNGDTNTLYFMTNFTPRVSNILAPAVPAHIENISVSVGGVVSLTFSITVGKSYRIQFKDDLGTLVWTPLGSDQIAGSSSITIHDNIGAHPQRFYHVVLLN